MRVLSDFHRLPRDVRKMLYKMIGFSFAFRKAFDSRLTLNENTDHELYLAIKIYQSIPYIAWLKSEGVSWDYIHFDYAVQSGNIDIVKWLIRYQCPISQERALCCANSLEIFQLVANLGKLNGDISGVIDHHLSREISWVIEILQPSLEQVGTFIYNCFSFKEHLLNMRDGLVASDFRFIDFFNLKKLTEHYDLTNYRDHILYELLLAFENDESILEFLDWAISKYKIIRIDFECLACFLKFGKLHIIRYIHQKFPEDFKLAWKKEYARYNDREFVEYLLDHRIPIDSNDQTFWKKIKL